MSETLWNLIIYLVGALVGLVIGYKIGKNERKEGV
jgi:hypothetical protein